MLPLKDNWIALDGMLAMNVFLCAAFIEAASTCYGANIKAAFDLKWKPRMVWSTETISIFLTAAAAVKASSRASWPTLQSSLGAKVGVNISSFTQIPGDRISKN